MFDNDIKEIDKDMNEMRIRSEKQNSIDHVHKLLKEISESNIVKKEKKIINGEELEVIYLEDFVIIKGDIGI